MTATGCLSAHSPGTSRQDLRRGGDLDVMVELCDRILVLCGGRVSGLVDGRSATKEQLGLLMTGEVSADA